MMVGLARRPAGTKKPTSRHVVHVEPLLPDELNGPNEMYIGIIDILTRYTCRKRFERVFYRCCRRNASCVPPANYAARFVNFFGYIFSCQPHQLHQPASEFAQAWDDRPSDLAHRFGWSAICSGIAGSRAITSTEAAVNCAT